MGVFQFSSQKYFSQLAVSSTRRELASITDNLESTLQHVINFSISASINDGIIRIARTYPTLPGSEAEQYAVRKKINTIINAIIALSPNIAMWDIMAKDGSFFQAGGYNLSELDSFDKEQIMKQHQNKTGDDNRSFIFICRKRNIKGKRKICFFDIKADC